MDLHSVLDKIFRTLGKCVALPHSLSIVEVISNGLPTFLSLGVSSLRRLEACTGRRRVTCSTSDSIRAKSSVFASKRTMLCSIQN